MRLTLTIIAVLIGFTSSFTVGLYLGATASLDKYSAEPGASKKAISLTDAPENPSTLNTSASLTKKVPAGKNSEDNEAGSTALQTPAPPLWLKETLAKARQKPGAEVKLTTTLGPMATAPATEPTAGDQKPSDPFSSKNYVVQTRSYIPQRTLKKLTDSISALKKSYVFIEPASNQYIGYKIVRVVGFSERSSARNFASTLSLKTGQDFIVLRSAL